MVSECTLYKTRALQHEPEHAAFIDLLKREGVRSYLEIGSKFGGSLWRVANVLPKGSRIVSVDLPWGDKSTQPHLEACWTELRTIGYDAHLFLGDSTGPQMVEQIRALAPFDCVFMDGNHTLPFVTTDWNNYGSMGRMIAFHDIAWCRPPEWNGGYRIDVPQFWGSLKGGYRHEEIKLDPTGQDNGIGVLWRS